jgi:hypothetical protein
LPVDWPFRSEKELITPAAGIGRSIANGAIADLLVDPAPHFTLPLALVPVLTWHHFGLTFLVDTVKLGGFKYQAQHWVN